MALDSFKGHSIDMGRNGEGTKEGPFVEQNNYSGSISQYQETVDRFAKLWDELCKSDPSQRQTKELIFDGQLGAAIRSLNSKGVVVDKDKLLRDMQSAYFMNNILNNPDFDIEASIGR